ncbi:energy transducer TonB [Mangrovimonas sp. AS39]|uniref:energy transducer TonB n=1 Tax=Mangrovimonas futianensis TaxID=2895523 RepID=UPI001E4630BE|nr:energy transducer TonB [Mangrovimonas futianensis]MCF1190227.1 energy transducer TonB [Mangrovimonas futianensis]MCF1194020.1 energy transducer TonB [Mangrovimonas futianensis]
MEKFTKNIDAIEAYLKEQLSYEEALRFEKDLESDVDFQNDFAFHKAFLGGVKRTSLKKDIQQARKLYTTRRYFKIGILITAALVGFLLVYLLVLKTNDNNSQDSKLPKKELPSKAIIVPPVSIDSILNNTIIDRKEDIPVEKKSLKGNEQITNTKDSVESNHVDWPVKKAVHFVLHSEKDTILKLPEGTKIKIKANSFRNSKGLMVQGEVDFRMTEYYKISDMLLANLSTTSEGKILETGGMLFVEALKEGENLELDQSIEISFPCKKKEKDMQLFTGEWSDSEVNWVLVEEEDELENLEVMEPVSEIFEEAYVEVPFNLVEQPPVFPGCQEEGREALISCFNEKMKAFFLEKFNLSIAEELKFTGKFSVKVFFKIDAEGNVFNVYAHAPHKKLGKEALRVAHLLPQMSPAKQRDKEVVVPYFIPLEFKFPGKTRSRRTFRVADDSLYVQNFDRKWMERDSIKASGKSSVSSSEILQYVMATSKLGWINCDRFVKSQKEKVKYKFKLKNADGSKVSLVFKSIKSILRGKSNNNYFDFGELPKEEEVMLVVIRKVGDTFYLGLKEELVRDISEMELDFKELDSASLKHELEKLNAYLEE